MQEMLTTLAQPWADVYAESRWLPTVVIAVHLLAMFLGGGIAIAADRQLLRAVPGRADAFLAAATELKATHAIVIAALVVTTLSGVALFTADVATFWASPVFWAKMATLVVLVANGVRMRRAESMVLGNASSAPEASVAGPEVTGPWHMLRTHAWISLGGWFALVLLGVVVANV